MVSRPGGPEVLEPVTTEAPAPGPGEVAVRVEAAGINFIDTYQRGGLYPMDFPFTPGLEGEGTVTGVGAGVSGLTVGDRVGWTDVLGSYAETQSVPADRAVPIPDGVEAGITAALLLQGMTAHYLATDTYPLKPGDRCLLHAGAGGVGLLLTQIAKARGAEVITTVGTEEKAALSREAGADQVIVYTEDSFGEEVERRHGPNPLNVVYDGVGADTFEQGLDLLRPRGMMVSFGNASGPPPDISPLTLMRKGSLFLTRPTMSHYLRTRQELLGRASDLFDMVLSGRLKVRIGSRYPLEEAAEAHRALEARLTTGKVLLEP